MSRKDYDDENININDDYLELLSKVDEYDDVYSNSDDQYEDIRSSSGDIYISSGRRNNADVYISNSPRSANPNVSDDLFEDDVKVYDKNKPNLNRQTRTYNEYIPPRPAKVSKSNTQELEDEVSDYDDRKRKKGKGGKIAVAVIAVVLAFIIGVGGYLSSVVMSIVSSFNKAEEIEHVEDVNSLVRESHVKNILLIGKDAEKGGASRSDSMMIASVNKHTGRITVCSVLRDTHVNIPGEGEAKINSAYAWGGPNLLVQTIEENFGIYIDGYAEVDFEMFTGLVDALGGIEVDVTEAESNYINNVHSYGNEEKPEYVPSGESVHLDGYQALWYARIRKLDSDWNRTERQRKVIGAIVSKAQQGGLTELVSVGKDVAPYITTTLSVGDFFDVGISLVSCFLKSGGETEKLFVSQQIPFEDTWHYSSEWDGSSISMDLDENKALLEELLYGDYTVEESTEADE